MKIRLLLYLLFASTLIFAQELKTTEILGETYGLSYNKTDNGFTICENVYDTNQKCSIVFIENNNTFVFQQELKDAITKAIGTFEYQILGSNLMLIDFNAIDYTSQIFEYNASELDTDGKEIEVAIKEAPDEFPEFKLKRISSGNYELSNTDVFAEPLTVVFDPDISDEANISGFIMAAMTQLDTKKSEIATYYQPKFKGIVETSLLKLLEDLYNTSITNDADYEFLASELLTDVVGTQRSYSFYQLLEANKFHVRVCEGGNCYTYTEFDNKVSESEFLDTMMTRHLIFDSASDLNKAILAKVYLLARGKVNVKQVETDKRAFETGLKETISTLENGPKTYSGKLVMNKKVRLFNKKTETPFIFNKNELVSDNKSKKIHLLIDEINMHVFNNRADKITIVGRLSNELDNTLTLSNLSYSLPFREFNSEDQWNCLKDKNGEEYCYRYVDVLDILPKEKYNYAVKNGDYVIKPNDTTLLPERKIGDYFTGIFFSDILGLNSNNGNSLITAEGRIRIPWHFRNFGRSTLFDNITIYASVNLVSGLDNTSRKIIVSDTFDPDETSAENAANFRSNNFNLLYNNNVDAGILLTPYTFEWKGASTFIHFRYGLRFLRTGVEYNLKERIESEDNGITTVQENLVEQRRFQLYSLGQEAEINFEIRPQSLFGADVTVGLNWFRANGTNKNDVDFTTFNNAPNLKVMANVYAFTDSDESNSGIFFRLGGHYNLGNYKVFPQLMVGYATNLSSFVNKVSKD